jgi:glycosyltransferase involved in cell wall biosynthesis
MQDELFKMSIAADVGREADSHADVNHYIVYHGYERPTGAVDTLMVTHIDSIDKLRLIRDQLETASLGVCMSSDTRRRLISAGIPSSKLCHIAPAHDGRLKPRRFIVGMTYRNNGDGRKRTDVLHEVLRHLSPDEFEFRIMGGGWEAIVDEMATAGFRVEYHDTFDPPAYAALITSLDYYLYFAHDEGSMGFLDALAAGVKTIVTPQGYHLDARGGITYSIDGSAESIVRACGEIVRERKARVESAGTWTWHNYALKHLEIWEVLLGLRHTHETSFADGLGSLGASDVRFSQRVSGLKDRVALGMSPLTSSLNLSRMPRGSPLRAASGLVT